MVSHELRTPLHAILGWIQVAKKVGSDPARLSEALDALERATHAQSQLVSDILDAQRMIRGDLKLCFGDICLDYVIKEAVELIAPQADEKRITVKILTSTSGIVVRGDKRRLSQCVCNLLSNAVKFSPPSSHIELEVSRAGASVGVVVRDYGQGIEADFLPRVFNRFEQEALEGERCPSGLGLGLAIVKGIIEAHGGAVRAESNGRGQGSVFTLIVPLTQQPPTQPSSLG
jgi:signal transduction histidine kinase